MTKYTWLNNAGDKIVAEEFGAALKRAAPGSQHMRVGRYAVVVSISDIYVAPVFKEHILDFHAARIERKAKHWEEHKRDRLSQCRSVRAMISQTHPLYTEVMEDTWREIEYFGAQ